MRLKQKCLFAFRHGTWKTDVLKNFPLWFFWPDCCLNCNHYHMVPNFVYYNYVFPVVCYSQHFFYRQNNKSKNTLFKKIYIGYFIYICLYFRTLYILLIDNNAYHVYHIEFKLVSLAKGLVCFSGEISSSSFKTTTRQTQVSWSKYRQFTSYCSSTTIASIVLGFSARLDLCIAHVNGLVLQAEQNCFKDAAQTGPK